MPPKAVKALDAQLSLMRFLKTEAATAAWQGFIDSTRTKELQADMFSRFDDGETATQREYQRLNASTTFFVENDMVTLASHASFTMPRQRFEYADLPCDYGFVVLETPILTMDIRGRRISVGAFSWGPAIGIDSLKNQIPGISLTFYSDVEDVRDDEHESLKREYKLLGELYHSLVSRWSLFHISNFAYGIDFVETTEHSLVDTTDDQGNRITVPQSNLNNEKTGTVDIHRFFYAFLVLSQQRIASVQRTLLDRHSQRRMKREMPEPPEDGAIQVVSLRRYSPPKDKDDEDEGLPVDWSHRWIVHGFWRNQYYPSMKEHRLVWINDYVKGPEHLPLVIKDTIYDLRR